MELMENIIFSNMHSPQMGVLRVLSVAKLRICPQKRLFIEVGC